VADCPFAVFGGAGEFALLAPLPPQPAAAKTPTTSAVAPARKVMDLVRVMLAPFVGCLNSVTQRACGRTTPFASRSHR
jgi:hypothetical protein